jgi:hypothetical protein
MIRTTTGRAIDRLVGSMQRSTTDRNLREWLGRFADGARAPKAPAAKSAAGDKLPATRRACSRD